MNTNSTDGSFTNENLEKVNTFISGLILKVENGTSTKEEEDIVSSYINFVEDVMVGLVELTSNDK